MKKWISLWLCLMLSLTALTACASDPSKIQSEFLEMLSEPVTEESIEAIGEFLDKNLSKMQPHDADQMVIAYEDYIFTLDGELLTYQDFQGRFEAYITEPLVMLYQIKAEEQENPMTKDAVLQLSWRALCDRAMFLELFIKENVQHDQVRKEGIQIYEYYINGILMGTSGTQIFRDGFFSEDAKNAYIEFAADYPDTTITAIINEYFAYLDSIQFQLDYKDTTETKVFFDTCAYLVSEAGKKV